jgi:uncharacterized protein (UPF0261 family)
MVAIAVVGMLDEREEGLRLIKDYIEKKGHEAILIDMSTGTGAAETSLIPEISNQDLAKSGGTTVDEIKGMLAKERDKANAIISKSLGDKFIELHESGRLKGIIAVGGATGSLITLPAMCRLPFGLPKILISSAAGSLDLSRKCVEYYAIRDLTVMHSVIDTVGLNNMVRRLMINGAGAICGMAEAYEPVKKEAKSAIALTELGHCEKGAHYIRELLEPDYSITSFHATGFGDRAAVDLVNQGLFEAFIDLVPAGYSEYLRGGNRAAGPDRLDVGRDLDKPYIIAPGGFDIISCGPMERKDRDDPLWMSRRLAERKLFKMDNLRVEARANAHEMKVLAQEVAKRLNQRNRKRVKFIIPTKGFSSLGSEGGALYDPTADEAFINSLKENLDPEIEIIEVDTHINSQEFSRAVARVLRQALSHVQDCE